MANKVNLNKLIGNLNEYYKQEQIALAGKNNKGRLRFNTNLELEKKYTVQTSINYLIETIKVLAAKRIGLNYISKYDKKTIEKKIINLFKKNDGVYKYLTKIDNDFFEKLIESNSGLGKLKTTIESSNKTNEDRMEALKKYQQLSKKLHQERHDQTHVRNNIKKALQALNRNEGMKINLSLVPSL